MERRQALPPPGLLPPSHPTPSEVCDGRSGESGRVTPLPLGGTVGGVRAAEPPLGGTRGGDGAMLSLGANYAQPGQAERGLSPTLGILRPSHPNPSKVGEGLCIQGDGGGGGVRSMSFSHLCTLLNAAANSEPALSKNRRLSAPTQTSSTHRLRMLKVCFISKSLLFQNQYSTLLTQEIHFRMMANLCGCRNWEIEKTCNMTLRYQKLLKIDLFLMTFDTFREF